MFTWLRTLLGKTTVELASDSDRIGEAIWLAGVSYSGSGNPYARAHDFKQLRLYASGKTTDYNLYRTTWRHVAGPPVIFPQSEGPPHDPR